MCGFHPPAGIALRGFLSIVGGYTQATGGSLQIEIGGSTATSGYDRLAVTGATVLDGTVEFLLFGGFVPTPADSFGFLTHASRAGYFPNVSNPVAGTYFIAYTNDTTTLTATGDNGTLIAGLR